MSAKANLPLRLGLAGLSHDHISIIEHISPEDFVIAAACEQDEALRAAIGRRYEVPAGRLYPDLAAMLENETLDAVAAFGSIRDHLDVVERCAGAGVHVMVEKPLAVSVDHAEAIARLARKHGIHVLTNYETSWYPSNAHVFRMVRDGAVGVPRKILIRAGHQGPIESGCQPQFLAWLTKPFNGGGALSDFGCYGANLATFFADGRLPSSVTAITRAFKQELYGEVEDDASIVLTYDQFEVVIQASWNWPFPRKDIELHGTAGSIAAADSRTVWLRSGSDSEATMITPDALPRCLGEPFAYLASVVRGQLRPAPHDLSALDNNRSVVRILDAARRSALAGCTIPVADRTA